MNAFPLCMPATIEGVRRLAFEAATLQDIDTVNGLELLAVKILKIAPVVKLMADESVELKRIVREEGRGFFIEWEVIPHVECPACEGSGELEAYGADDRKFDVECPACEGLGDDPDAEGRFIYTDLDGNPVEDAA